jgi:hypothetical protein
MVPRPDLGVGGDRAREVGIDQEVLTERPRGPDPVPRRQLSDRPDAEPSGRPDRRALRFVTS